MKSASNSAGATQGSKEKVALRNEPLLVSLAIQLNAGPMFLGGSRLRSEHHNGREEVHVNNECTQRKESMTTIMAIRLASLVTAIDVLVASGFSIAAIIRPQILVPAESVRTQASLLLAMYAAEPQILVSAVSAVFLRFT